MKSNTYWMIKMVQVILKCKSHREEDTECYIEKIIRMTLHQDRAGGIVVKEYIDSHLLGIHDIIVEMNGKNYDLDDKFQNLQFVNDFIILNALTKI